MKKNQKIVVDIELSQNVLNENKDLNDCYNPESKQLVYELSGELPKDFVDTLSEFMKDDVVGKGQLAVFNPLVIAINQLQQLKGLTYSPELSDDEIMKLAEQFNVFEIETDEDGDIFFNIIPEHLAKLKTPAAIAKYNEKVEKGIRKAFDNGHDDSYQDCKDAVKIIGSFNTSLNVAKKTLKEPYSSVIKKIDSIYKIFKQESDNTKECVLENFKEAVDIEQKKKDERQARKDAEANQKIEELSETNKEQQEKLDNQMQATKKAQLKNNIEYGDIGGISKSVAFDSVSMTKEALITSKEIYENATFDNLMIKNERDLSILDDDDVTSLRAEFSANKTRWITIIQREIKLREEKEDALVTKTKLETVQQNPQASFSGSDTPPILPETPVAKVFTLEGTDDEKFNGMIIEIERLLAEQKKFTDVLQATHFEDQEYAKRTNALLMQSFPTVTDSYTKIISWAKNFKNEYLTFLKNQ